MTGTAQGQAGAVGAGATTTTESAPAGKTEGKTEGTSSVLTGETAPGGAQTQGATTEATKPADGKQTEATAPTVQPELKLTLPEGVKADEALLSDFTAVAKESGLKQEYAQKIVDSFVKAQGRVIQGFEQERAANNQAWLAAAKRDKEYGGQSFDKNALVARAAMSQFATPEFSKFLDETGLTNHPEMVRFCFRVGKAIASEDSIAGTAGSGPGAAPSRDERLASKLYGESKET